tara:strand:- start:4160 stop:4819 length:660 start_codon:yes stop_codon:yes gene_type:complete
MGKGSSQTTEVKIPKWQEDEIKSALEKAKGLNLPYAPYMGITSVAPREGRDASLNMARSAFGLPQYKSALPTPTEMGGMRGYRAYDVYADALERFKQQNPDHYARIVAQTAPQGTINPVSGMPLTAGDTSATPVNATPQNAVTTADVVRNTGSDDNWSAPAHTGMDLLDWISGTNNEQDTETLDAMSGYNTDNRSQSEKWDDKDTAPDKPKSLIDYFFG